MILTGPEIVRAVRGGEIAISPFDPDHLEPNSYQVCLGRHLLVCAESHLDVRVAPAMQPDVIPDHGRVLWPGVAYLGETAEVAGGRCYAATLDTTRSAASLGLWIQVMAPLGHTGAIVRWTLELVVAQPLRVYPGMPVGKIAFWVPAGPAVPYQGRYLNSQIVRSSALSQDFSPQEVA